MKNLLIFLLICFGAFWMIPATFGQFLLCGQAPRTYSNMGTRPIVAVEPNKAGAFCLVAVGYKGIKTYLQRCSADASALSIEAVRMNQEMLVYDSCAKDMSFRRSRQFWNQVMSKITT